MKLSVILPCYNGAASIAVQLEALAHQQWAGGWELVVVDNGSTDASMQVVLAYQDRLPGLRIVPAHVPGTPHLNVSHSYNTGVAAATGDAFVFCEADDEVAPGWLHAMGEALEWHDFVAARMDHRKLNPPWLHPLEGDGYQSDRLSRLPGYPNLCHASGCTFGLRRAVWEHVGPLDLSFPCVNDTDYSWRAQLLGHELHFVPSALVHYREKQALRARFRQGREWGCDYIRLLQHYGAPRGNRSSPARRLAWVLRCLPEGAWVAALSAMGAGRGRQRLAQWVWNLGWAVGELRASLGPSREPRAELLALAGAHTGERRGARAPGVAPAG